MKKILLGSIIFMLLACSSNPGEVETTSQQAQTVETVEAPVPTDISDWVLKDAKIVFTTTKTDKKGNDIQEVGDFKQYSGFFDKQGQFRLEINLNSLTTDIIIRDQRIKEWLLETDKFTNATIIAKLDAEKINQLALHESIQLTQPVQLDLHGMQADLTANLAITRTQPNVLSVNTIQPILISLDSFDMLEGLQKLTDVMMLSEINQTIPVSFKGEFHRP